MKTLFSVILFGVSFFANAQNKISLVGQYEQKQFTGPPAVQSQENELLIRQDPKAAKVAYIENLLPAGTVKAVLFSNDSPLIYTIPVQKVGNYQITVGCLVYEKNGKVIISLNNEQNCRGMSPDDYGQVLIGKGKIKANGVEIDGNGKGSIKTDGVTIGDGAINVDAKAIMAGVQYVGRKKGMAKQKANDDDNDDDN